MRHLPLTRRTILRSAALATASLAAPSVRDLRAQPNVAPRGKMTLAWHTNIAARWLDPQQHDGTASPDNFTFALHDALIKNFREVRYDHLALADKYDFAEDAKSATFRLRPGIKFHDGTPVTPQDVKWSFETYSGAWSAVCKERLDGIDLVDDRTVKFHFKEPFLDFPILLGTGNVCGAGWVLPQKYYERVGRSAFMQKPIGAGPYRLAAQQPGIKLEFEAVDGLLSPDPHQAADDAERSRGGDPRRHARERRGRHHLQRAGRADRAGQGEQERDPGPGPLRQLVAGVPGVPGSQEPVPQQAGAPGGKPGRRSRCDQPGRMRRHGQGQRQLDQRRRRVRHGLAEI